ncbi:MAG: hypothetical protein ABIJ95_06570, partial [Pseudomonadota bacterium]
QRLLYPATEKILGAWRYPKPIRLFGLSLYKITIPLHLHKPLGYEIFHDFRDVARLSRGGNGSGSANGGKGNEQSHRPPPFHRFQE